MAEQKRGQQGQQGQSGQQGQQKNPGTPAQERTKQQGNRQQDHQRDER